MAIKGLFRGDRNSTLNQREELRLGIGVLGVLPPGS